jgi:mannose-6-phosphate isomerase-like protein (cupin superfamily)
VGARNNGTSYLEFSNCVVPGQALRGRSFGAGVESAAIWATNGMPVGKSGTKDAANSGTFIATGDRSTSFSLISFGVVKSFLHHTRSTDYWVILKGQVTLITDTGRIQLKEGDVLINRGGDHAWYRKPGTPAALALTVSISAKARPGKGTLAGPQGRGRVKGSKGQ